MREIWRGMYSHMDTIDAPDLGVQLGRMRSKKLRQQTNKNQGYDRGSCHCHPYLPALFKALRTVSTASKQQLGSKSNNPKYPVDREPHDGLWSLGLDYPLHSLNAPASTFISSMRPRPLSRWSIMALGGG